MSVRVTWKTAIVIQKSGFSSVSQAYSAASSSLQSSYSSGSLAASMRAKSTTFKNVTLTGLNVAELSSVTQSRTAPPSSHPTSKPSIVTHLSVLDQFKIFSVRFYFAYILGGFFLVCVPMGALYYCSRQQRKKQAQMEEFKSMKEWGVNWWEINGGSSSSGGQKEGGHSSRLSKPASAVPMHPEFTARVDPDTATGHISTFGSHMPRGSEAGDDMLDNSWLQSQLQDSISRLYLPENGSLRASLGRPLRQLDKAIATILMQTQPLSPTELQQLNTLASRLRAENEQLTRIIKAQESSSFQVGSSAQEEYKDMPWDDVLGEAEMGSPGRKKFSRPRTPQVASTGIRAGITASTRSPVSPSDVILDYAGDADDRRIQSAPVVSMEDIYPSWQQVPYEVTNTRFSPSATFRGLVPAAGASREVHRGLQMAGGMNRESSPPVQNNSMPSALVRLPIDDDNVKTYLTIGANSPTSHKSRKNPDQGFKAPADKASVAKSGIRLPPGRKQTEVQPQFRNPLSRKSSPPRRYQSPTAASRQSQFHTT